MTTARKLTKARETLAELEQKISELASARERRLLNGEAAAAVVKIEDEIAALRRAARTETDRIALLTKAAEREESEAVARRRAGLIERFARKLELADAKADELQATMAKADQLFRDIVRLRQEARSAWPAGDSHTNSAAATAEGAALSGGAVKQLLAYEICRVGSRPVLGGQPGEIKEPDFPGGLNPRPLDWAGTPGRITPLGAALRQASTFALDMMKSRLDPIKALAPGQAVAPADGEPRTAAEQKLAALLKLQNELAADLSRESEYFEVVAQIAALSNDPQTGATK